LFAIPPKKQIGEPVSAEKLNEGLWSVAPQSRGMIVSYDYRLTSADSYVSVAAETLAAPGNLSWKAQEMVEVGSGVECFHSGPIRGTLFCSAFCLAFCLDQSFPDGRAVLTSLQFLGFRFRTISLVGRPKNDILSLQG
jgi:hypothetical protein